MAPDTNITVPTILSEIPANPELDRMFCTDAIETTKVPKPRRISPILRYFRAATNFGVPICKFNLTKYAKKDVIPIVPKIVVESVPIVFSRPTATTMQDNENTSRALNRRVKPKRPALASRH